MVRYINTYETGNISYLNTKYHTEKDATETHILVKLKQFKEIILFIFQKLFLQ